MTRRWISVGSVSTVCAMWMLACSSSGGAPTSGDGGADDDHGGGGPLTPLSPATDVDSFVAQYCALTNPCCSDAGLSTDMKTCRTVLAAQLAGGAGYDRLTGDQCLARVEAWARRPLFCAAALPNFGPSCDRISARRIGTAKPGESCGTVFDCASSPDGEVDCVVNTGADAGAPSHICQLAVVGKAGDGPCVSSLDGLDYLVLQLPSSPPTSSTLHVCRTSDGLRCDDATSKCAPLKALGEPCTPRNLDCGADGMCDASAFPTKCAPRRAVGAACTASEQNECGGTAVCRDPNGNNVCAAPGPDGSKCIAGAHCTSAFCDQGICKSQAENAARVGLCGK